MRVKLVVEPFQMPVQMIIPTVPIWQAACPHMQGSEPEGSGGKKILLIIFKHGHLGCRHPKLFKDMFIAMGVGFGPKVSVFNGDHVGEDIRHPPLRQHLQRMLPGAVGEEHFVPRQIG